MLKLELADDPLCSPLPLHSTSSSTDSSGASLVVQWCLLTLPEPLELPLSIVFLFSCETRPQPPLGSLIPSCSGRLSSSHVYMQVRLDPLSLSIPLDSPKDPSSPA